MLITLENVNYIYNAGAADETHALRDVSLTLGGDSITAIAGSTGSGKSTLVKLLNGILSPSSGRILYDGREVEGDKKALRDIRCRVGMCFQYPEYQLFEETVIKDVAFGPKNMGLSNDEAMERAEKALKMTGTPENIFLKSPFDISGGEKRRVAIAGVISMEPEILVLDEPTAGLDPCGKEDILNMIRDYQQENKTAVIMVSHNMTEIAEYAKRMIALSEGRVVLDGEPHEVFSHEDILNGLGLGLPEITYIYRELNLPGNPITMDEAVRLAKEALG